MFMGRGHIYKWKLPIVYYLSSGPTFGSAMKEQLQSCISKLPGIGLTVLLVISDQGSTNINLFETLLGVTIDNPFFRHDNSQIFVMYDPPHLVKSVRNNLKNSGFNVDG